jgi:hypothetical protein
VETLRVREQVSLGLLLDAVLMNSCLADEEELHKSFQMLATSIPSSSPHRNERQSTFHSFTAKKAQHYGRVSSQSSSQHQ